MASPYGPYPGVVELVHDGDTIYCALDLGFDLTVHTKVRVLGINAPELSTSEGKEARDFAQEALPIGAKVQIISYGWDKYGGRIDGSIQMRHAVNANGTLYTDFASLMIDTGHAVMMP